MERKKSAEERLKKVPYYDALYYSILFLFCTSPSLTDSPVFPFIGRVKRKEQKEKKERRRKPVLAYIIFSSGEKREGREKK